MRGVFDGMSEGILIAQVNVPVVGGGNRDALGHAVCVRKVLLPGAGRHGATCYRNWPLKHRRLQPISNGVALERLLMLWPLVTAVVTGLQRGRLFLWTVAGQMCTYAVCQSHHVDGLVEL